MKKILGPIVLAAMPLLLVLAVGVTPFSASAFEFMGHEDHEMHEAGHTWHHFFHWHSGKGSLVVMKKTMGGNGTFQMTGTNGVGAFSITTHHRFGVKTVKNLEPGTVTITETPSTGWTQFSNTCANIVIKAHRTAFCMIVNHQSTVVEDPTPTATGGLKITKTTTGGDGSFSFTGSAGDFSIVTESGSGIHEVTLPVGTYSVSENPLEGWNIASTGCDSIVVTANATSTCTIANEKVQATGGITVIKNTVGGEGTFSFTGIDAFSITTVGQTGKLDIYDVPAGSFSLAETAQSGWTQSSFVCTNGTAVLANATTTCTVTNTKNQDAAPVQTGGGGGGGGGSGSNGPISGSLSGSGGGGGGGTGWTFKFPQVLGASSTTLPELPKGCSALLTKYMRKGKANDASEVKKLQKFLNDELGLKLQVNGFFGSQTDKGVRSFQLKHKPQVLTPWSLSDPTGYVYKTTERWINLSACSSLVIPMPALN